MIIVGDSLYSKAPFVTELLDLNYSYILVAKPDDHKSLYTDIEGLRKGGLIDFHTSVEKDKTYLYEWSNEHYLTDFGTDFFY